MLELRKDFLKIAVMNIDGPPLKGEMLSSLQSHAQVMYQTGQQLEAFDINGYYGTFHSDLQVRQGFFEDSVLFKACFVDLKGRYREVKFEVSHSYLTDPEPLFWFQCVPYCPEEDEHE